MLGLIGYLLLGIWIHGDYGISWDETTSRRTGIISTHYALEPLFGGLKWEYRESDDLDHPGESELERLGWWSRPWAWALGFWRRDGVSSPGTPPSDR